MSPVDEPPERLCRIVLVEKMVFTIDFDESIGVIEPVGWSGEMIRWSGVHTGLRGGGRIGRGSAAAEDCRQTDREKDGCAAGRTRLLGKNSRGDHLINGSRRSVPSM